MEPYETVCAPHSPAWWLRWPNPALLCRWAMSCCLLTLLCACASPPASTTTRMPANLDRPCDPGPPIPAAEVRVAVLLEIMAQREAAAAECRAVHEQTRRAWPR